MQLGALGSLLIGISLGALACRPEVTFAAHVAPILQQKCQSCHRPGQMAPMSLLDYEETRPFAAAIRWAILSGSMPPFFAGGPIGYYKHDIRLTETEKRTIVDWVEKGAPEGDPADLPQPVTWEDSEWPFGEPDLILPLPAHAPDPTGTDQWVALFADHAFSHDLWARAIHLRTRSRKAVHHASLFLVEPSEEVPEGLKAFEHERPERGALFTWFPGLVIDPLPEGQAIRLGKSWRMAAWTHFAPTREPVQEQMDVGIYFADGVVDRIQKSLWIRFTRELVIPPGAPNFTLRGKRKFAQAAEISHFMVHMHLRGKSSKIILHYPDGSQRTVFDLPRYRFNWQRYYYLAEPLTVPAGTVAEFVAVWDNSILNPWNPDPTAWCVYGKRSVDEMYGAAIFYAPKQPLAVPLRVANGRG